MFLTRDHTFDLLSVVAEECPGHLYVYDNVNERYLFVSKAILDFLGLPFSAIVADRWLMSSRILPEDLERLKFRKDNGDGENDLEFRMTDQSGDTRWFRGRERVFQRSPAGAPEAVVGCFMDITEIMKAKKTVEESITERSQFLANITHEIRSPLAAILGFSDLLTNKSLDRSDANRYLQRISSNGNQLLNLVDDILSLTKVDSGTMAVHLEGFKIADLLSDVAESASAKAFDQNLRIECDPSAMPNDRFFSDPLRIRQILTNLLDNAIKFSKNGSIQLAAQVNNERAIIAVTDDGIGISPESVAKIFTPFGQADETVGRNYGGTGLGLALSKHLAEILGGRLELTYSKLGVGSQFSLIIPNQVSSVQYQTQVTHPVEIIQANVLRGLRVLVAEDSEDTAFLVAHYLTKEGAVVKCVADGVKAVACAIAEPFDTILLDIRMPLMDGFQALDQLKSNNVKVPIFAFTAQANDDHDILNRGFSGLIRKPISREQLISSIRKGAAR